MTTEKNITNDTSVNSFLSLGPSEILEAAEVLGKEATGRYFQLNAMENRVFEIEFEDQTKSILKFYRPGRWSANQIKAEHRFLKVADDNDIPVVAPLQDDSGESLFQIEGLFFALFPKRAGRLEGDLSEERLRQFGRQLGKLHNVGASLVDLDRRSLTTEIFGDASIAILEKKRVIPKNLEIAYLDLAKKVVAACRSDVTKAERILTHGDCHVGNVLWRDDQLTFIDFDDCIYANPVQDLWLLAGGEDEESVRKREIILSGYELFRFFDHYSLKLIPSYRALRIIYFSAWIAQRWDDDSFKRAFPGFIHEPYWVSEMEALYGIADLL